MNDIMEDMEADWTSASSESTPPEPPDASERTDFVERRDTLSSKAGSEGGFEKGDTCRICRSEATPDEPLFYPCKCSGSIKFVHQECLMEWLSHSHKKHCELCKTPFRFTKLYDANMPQKLPWQVFFKRACWHVAQLVLGAGRATLVALVWFGTIPWLIRWVWRWFFWIVDAAWAREAFMRQMRSVMEERLQRQTTTVEWLATVLQRLIQPANFSQPSANPLDTSSASAVANDLGFGGENSTSTFTWPQADPSILSSWSYLSSLTSSPRANRVILDVFEGQIITCIVITGFILVFLIREWVVQQQPLVNLEHLGHAQQQLREATERLEAERERMRRQQELLEQARRRLIELQNETEESYVPDTPAGQRVQYIGWENLAELIDRATEHLRSESAEGRADFVTMAEEVTRQIKAAGSAGVDLKEFTDNVHAKLASYADPERKAWETVLVSAINRTVQRNQAQGSAQPTPDPGQEEGAEQTEGSSDVPRRPRMPDREFSSRATNIQRLLEEADAMFNGPSNSSLEGASSSHADGRVAGDSAEESMDGGAGPHLQQSLDPIPITNAGPDAKVNIKRSGKGKMRAVPEPKIHEKMLTDDELKKQLEDEVTKELEEEIRVSRSQSIAATAPDAGQEEANQSNPFHPEGPEPDRRENESFGHRVASAFREEFGLDEAEELESLRSAGHEANGGQHRRDINADQLPLAPENAPRGYLERLAHWFWGDIQPPNAREPVPAPNEELLGADENEAPFVPILDRLPDVPAARPVAEAQPHHDPEVLAAAQQAGLDPEAIEEAEDLEGIFELIGFQGPLIGLFQTSAFCTLLVACTIICAIVLPYAGGKVVLNILGSPLYILVKMPLQIASAVADFIIDLTLLVGGYAVMLTALGADWLSSAAEVWIPSLARLSVAGIVVEYAKQAAANAASRLSSLFVSGGEPVDAPTVEVLAISWALLGSSVHAHASLRTIQDEVNAVLSCMSMAVTFTVETISTGSVLATCKKALLAVLNLENIRTAVASTAQFLRENVQPVIESLQSLRNGEMTMSNPRIVLDPSLVYWNSTDRAFAILAGYAALAALATIYVAFDKPITKSESGKRTEKMIRDTLRQAGGVLKVILIISIEMLVFPLYCGLLLDIAFLPLFQNATMASRWAFAGHSPYTFCFVHWFVGTCYMFHFALFVGMCRKILRKGVLWFIRDPDDPTFHPVRDVLERNVVTQLRKIAFSALVYGALVILCLGGVIWTIGKLFDGIFPIYWISTEPILEFPLDLCLYNFITPLIIRLFKPSDAVNALYTWWLRRCARVLRLSHFLFDDRRKDEEGRFVRKTWVSFLLLKKSDLDSTSTEEQEEVQRDPSQLDVYFERDGKYVLTPCNDQYRPPKPGEAFMHVDDDDVYIADKEGKKNEHFAKVYVPPLFRSRIAMFMVCLWMFSAFTGLCATLVPLVFGRTLFTFIMPAGIRVNDIYAYSLGAYVLCGLYFAAVKSRQGAVHLKKQATKANFHAWVAPVRRFSVRAIKCVYVYGFIGIVLPCIFAILLQFYLILPLHTAFISGGTEPPVAPLEQSVANMTSTLADQIPIISAVINDTAATVAAAAEPRVPTLGEHTIHILQDYALGLLYVRIASRLVIAAPASRAAEAFRLITGDGYTNPNARLATRFFILPVTLLTLLILLLPPLAAGLAIHGIHTFVPQWTLDEQSITKLYRYSYPLASTCVVLGLTVAELGKATSRWRARIRDEVYLVGERLHNFGERRPPPGSRSVVRREK